MSVRGSKSKVIFYIGGICSVLFVVLLYHNASQKLEDVEKLYERCHLNEESLSAQLQVNLEYKVRLEKSLQQEKSEHVQIKEDMQNKLEDERQTRERENLESNNKFTALQQQYKFLQGQHEDLNSECKKLRQIQLNEKEEKIQMNKEIQSLKNELKLVKDSKESNVHMLKMKHLELEKENFALKAEKIKLLNQLNLKENHKSERSQFKSADELPFNSTFHETEVNENILQQPLIENKLNLSSTKSSSPSPKKLEQELFLSGNNIYMNTSTPMINPDAVMSQDKILSAAPVPQPHQESYQNFPAYYNKDNVGAKSEEENKKVYNEVPAQGIIRAPDIMNDFGHVPAIHKYREKLKQVFDRNNNGGEVGDEGEPVVKHNVDNEKHWREGELGVPFVQNSAGEIPKNQIYHYQAEYDRRKEDGEDDDDVDQLDYHNGEEKNRQQEGIHMKIPFENKRESVMIQPK